jgi:hypothetical protein
MTDPFITLQESTIVSVSTKKSVTSGDDLAGRLASETITVDCNTLRINSSVHEDGITFSAKSRDRSSNRVSRRKLEA